MKILFVCSANVGRSQMAQGFYNILTNSSDASSAAGIEKLREKYDNKPHHLVIELMKGEGVDISSQKITYLEEIDLDMFDQIIVFCEPADCLINLSDRQNVRHIHIEDPAGKGTSDSDFLARLASSMYQIKQVVVSLIKD